MIEMTSQTAQWGFGKPLSTEPRFDKFLQLDKINAIARRNCCVWWDIVLGREHSHATGQSQGQSHTTEQYEQTKATERPGQTTGRPRDEQHNSQKVQSVMAPMTQPVGGWHVTSMTGRSRPTRPHRVTHDYTGPT